MRNIALFLLVGVFVWVSGCQQSNPNRKEMVSVEGTVTLDGQPMSEGDVVFRPPDPTHPPAVFKISNGRFSGKATIGKRKVEVMAYKEVPPPKTATTQDKVLENYIPARYNKDTILEAEVTQDGPNTFEFKVQSK